MEEAHPTTTIAAAAVAAATTPGDAHPTLAPRPRSHGPIRASRTAATATATPIAPATAVATPTATAPPHLSISGIPPPYAATIDDTLRLDVDMVSLPDTVQTFSTRALGRVDVLVAERVGVETRRMESMMMAQLATLREHM